ncbi:hypothetical protein HU734_017595 [Pseudomonas wayambapalatensis]|nr:hypothetical protein HU734_017595 [Pseudomonas wayambapalatensis]
MRVAAIDQAQRPGKLPSRSGEVAARQGTSSPVGGAADGLHWSTAQPGPSTPITLAQPYTETIVARDTSHPAMTSVAAPTLQQALPTKDGGMDAARDLVNLEGADQRSDKLLRLYKRDPSLLSQDEKVGLAAYL